MYISKITLENIKAFTSLSLDFTDRESGWHVLIGNNGAGKTGLLRSIAYCLLGPGNSNALNISMFEYLRWGAIHGKFDIWLRRTEYDLGITDEAWKIGQIVRDQNYILRHGTGRVGGLGEFSSPHRSQMFLDVEGNGWFVAGFGTFRRFLGPEREEKTQGHKARALRSLFLEDASLVEALGMFYRYYIKSRDNPESSEAKVLVYLIPFINLSGLLPEGFSIISIDSERVLCADGRGNHVSIGDLSDGPKAILALVFEIIRQLEKAYTIDVLLRNWHGDVIDLPGVVLIDEVDAHLHPTWQTRIGNWFTAHFPKIQFIVTTHSPLICRAAEKGTIWRLPSPGSDEKPQEVKGLDRKRLLYGDILDAYGTELFGESVSVSQSPETKRLHYRMLELQAKSMDGLTSDAEELELDELRSYL